MKNTDEAALVNELALKWVRMELTQFRQELFNLKNGFFFGLSKKQQKRADELNGLISSRESWFTMLKKREARLGEGARKKVA
jgi:hypothetical protein